MPQDAHADGVRAGERGARNRRMLEQRVADQAARAGQVAEHTRREAGIGEHLHQQPTAPGGIARHLEDHRIAGNQRGGDRRTRQSEREIERCDNGPRAIRLEHGSVAADESLQRVVGQAPLEPLVVFHLVAIPFDQVGGLLYFTERLHPVLADLQRDDGRDVVDALLDQRSRAPQHVDAFLPGLGCPNRTGVLGGVYGRVHVVRRSGLEARQQPVPVDRRANLLDLAVAGHAPAGRGLPADQQRVFAAELRPHAGQCRLEIAMQLRRRLEHRRIGQAKRRAGGRGTAPSAHPSSLAQLPLIAWRQQHSGTAMELNHQEITVTPRAAASVVMLRDAAPGMQVLLLKRHESSSVLGGAHVFPGGKLDPADTELDMGAHLDRDLPALHAALGEPGLTPLQAAGLHVAALREAFEESGLLLAHGVSARLAAVAALRMTKGLPFNQLLADLWLRLDTSNLVPWSRWITPKVPSVTSKRFDTRFFIALVNDDVEVSHDDFEAVASAWLRPRDALELYWSGQMALAPPQIMSLAHLSRHRRGADVLDEARRCGPILIEPVSCEIDGERVVCYPGDERHPLAARGLPGPSRLVFRNRRFEPFGGFESLFD
jgi:8-oxo-dGTP pyrophosphatase MutT (NUDIX family)